MTTTAQDYMATLGMEQSRDQLWKLLTEIEAADKAEALAKAALQGQRYQLELREAELLLDGVDGKNQTEREAALHVKLEGDSSYRLLMDNIFRSESDLSAAQVDGAALRREWQYHRLVLEVGIAKLGFLAAQPRHENGHREA